MKIFICFLCFVCVAAIAYENADEIRAKKYGVDDMRTFLLNASEDYRENRSEMSLYSEGNIKAYREFVNIEIINILERDASMRGKMNYSAFVKRQAKEIDIPEYKVRYYKEIGQYIDEYDKYVYTKEQKLEKN